MAKFKRIWFYLGLLATIALSFISETLAPTIIYIFIALILLVTEIKPRDRNDKEAEQRSIDELIESQRARIQMLKTYTLQIQSSLSSVQEKVEKL